MSTCPRRPLRSVAVLLALSAFVPPARASWDVEVMGDIGGSIVGSSNPKFEDFYKSIFTVGSGNSGSGFMAFIPLGFDVWIHFNQFGIGYYGSLDLNGPGGTTSGSYTVDPGYYSYYYDDGYSWYYVSYYDPGGTYNYAYGIGLSQVEKAVMFEYRLPVWETLFKNPGKTDSGGGLALQFGIGKVSVDGTISNSDEGHPDGDYSFGFSGSGPLYIFGVDLQGYGSMLGFGMQLQYRSALIPQLKYSTGSVVKDTQGNDLPLDYGGVFINFSFGFGFGNSSTPEHERSYEAPASTYQPPAPAPTPTPATGGGNSTGGDNSRY